MPDQCLRTRLFHWVSFVIERHYAKQLAADSVALQIVRGEFIAAAMLCAGDPARAKTEVIPGLGYSLCHLAVLTGDLALVEATWHDNITPDWSGSSPLHLAALCAFDTPRGARDIVRYLTSLAINTKSNTSLQVRNRYAATAEDYLAITAESSEQKQLQEANPQATIKYVNLTDPEPHSVVLLTAEEAVRKLNVSSWDSAGAVRASRDFLEFCFSPQLTRSKAQIPQVFSEHNTSNQRPQDPDSRLILGFISPDVGHGVFAAQDIPADTAICAYGGLLLPTAQLARFDYCVKAVVPGFSLDGSTHRSWGSCINHSDSASNAKLVGSFDRGLDTTIVVSTRAILRGQQILINYGDGFFEFTAAANKPAIVPLEHVNLSI
eukprot:comp17425_c0_seq1/m.29437 comp17425_c0_seq1/g.29437  ORF comp17425_c0_seq1/g.29437 comp17425_c0_seq1/m.29437 type:complete len:378 (+) comp17425_c0_seq1:38-1171(+)